MRQVWTLLASPFLLLVVAGFLFAAKVMVSKAALDAGVQPFQLGVIGNLGAGVILFPWLLGSKTSLPCSPRHLLLYLLLGLISFALPVVLSHLVVARVGPAYGATIYCLSPLLTMTLAVALRLEKIYFLRSFGIILGFVGMIALVQQQLLQIDMSQHFWVISGLAIPVCAAFGNIMRSAYWPRGTSALAFSCATLVVSSAMLGVAAPFFESPANWHFADASIAFWLLAFICVSAISYLANFRLQELAGPVVFSQIGYWGTGFGILLAATLFEDVLTTLSFIGMGCIVSGSALARRRAREEPAVIPGSVYSKPQP
ncbi:DMT family transporter [Rhizobium tumorigenes]|uniref:DMT family transporter n=1 Tax=Rhizobium tumorigenes TaxID=2041385 RepID=UPI00241F4CB3|nr:DMT family transporter [Rhizobium tumorigenes]WFS03870.1 DMT family transporter [Rhizobium tumorigenes]